MAPGERQNRSLEMTNSSISPREEEGIPAGIPTNLAREIPFHLILIPRAGRVDVLIPHIPSPIDHLCVVRVVFGTFQCLDIRLRLCGRSFCFGIIETHGIGRRGGGLRRCRSVAQIVEYALAVRTEALVDKEVVEVVVLASQD